MRCPNCRKEGTLRDWEGQLELLGVQVVGRGTRCASCGETVFDSGEVDRQQREAIGLIAARGVRKGNELKLARKALDMRASELAELLDVRPETVSRWERDEVEIPRTVAFAIYQLLEHPKATRQRLERIAAG
jgi:DNA-binding XRE family transcriptional regulator